MQKSCNFFYMSAARRSWIAATSQATFGIPEHARKVNTCALHIDWRSHRASGDRQRFGTYLRGSGHPKTLRTGLGKECPQLSGVRGLTCAKTDVPPLGERAWGYESGDVPAP